MEDELHGFLLEVSRPQTVHVIDHEDATTLRLAGVAMVMVIGGPTR